jgi:protocatechuate 3,4-dioxygenase beta subunit
MRRARTTTAPIDADTGSDPEDLHHRGLAFDVGTLMARRRALQVIGGAGLLALVGCSSSGSEGAATTTTAAAAGAAGAAGGASTTAGSPGAASGVIPEETAGPFPGDGSNGPDVLAESGVVRQDITTSIGSASGTAEGVPLSISLVVADAATGKARTGAAVYVWHCSREGGYSMYSAGVEDQNFLRGVQETGSDGTASFTSIFPGAYDGRWPHIHFEVYEDLAAATSGGQPIATSQIALPEDACDAVYATEGYEASVANLARTSLQTDMVFADSYESELGTVTGNVDDGYSVSLPVGI